MEPYNVQFEKKESLYELESQVNKESLILCDDIQNNFMIVEYDDAHRIGIAYYDYGITPAFFYSQDYTYLYLGVGKKLISIDLIENKIIENENLQSLFYEFICDSKKNYVCVICELDLYCYLGNKLSWKIGFKDIVCDYSIVDDSKISIKCDDGMEYLFSLKDGTVMG